MYDEPTITVKDVEEKISRGNGMASKVAMIGAFNTTDDDINIFFNHESAYEKYKGNNEENEKAHGLKALKYLFKKEEPSLGIESLIISNITTMKEEKTEPATNTIPKETEEKEDNLSTLKEAKEKNTEEKTTNV